jgi:hypothetical protein
MLGEGRVDARGMVALLCMSMKLCSILGCWCTLLSQRSWEESSLASPAQGLGVGVEGVEGTGVRRGGGGGRALVE